MVDLYPFNVIIYINLLIVCVSLEMVWFYWSNYMHKQFQPTNCTGRFVFLLGFYWLHSGIWTSNLNSRIIIPVTFISVCGSFEFINSTIAVMENHLGSRFDWPFSTVYLRWSDEIGLACQHSTPGYFISHKCVHVCTVLYFIV